MAAVDRMSFLPMIKCSSCGVDIEITHLADHVCATPSPNFDEPPPPPPKLDRAATLGVPSFTDKTPSQLRTGRMPPPPRINPSAANKPFFPQPQYSPMSNYSDPKSRSPLSPSNGQLPFKMNRSATSPMPRPLHPPSPDLPSNMDCAFPPFPASGNATPTSANPNTREQMNLPPRPRYAEADPLYAPLSPRTNGGQNVAKRMDTIAPGPFDGRSDLRPSTSEGRWASGQRGSEYGHRRTATQSSTRSTRSNGALANQRTSLASTLSRSSTFSTRSGGLPSRPKPGMGDPMPPPPRPARKESNTEGIDAFLERLQKETSQPPKIAPESRSKTFPLRQESRDATQPPPRPRRPSESGGPQKQPTDPGPFNPFARSNNLFPARSSSRGGASRPQLRPDDAPPLPAASSYGKGLPPNPLHTPSDSGLSDDSVSSSGFRSAASSRSSPPASETSGDHSRNVSKIARTDYMDEEPIPRTTSPESFMAPRTPPRPTRRNESTGYNRGKAPEPLLQTTSAPFSDALESPMDPAIQRGLFYEKRPSEPREDPALRFGQSPPRQKPEPPRIPEQTTRNLPNRRPTAASKGKCRGCSEPIVGKSIKDSSGRLTGRYHRDCFVCRTCRSPFPSAEFYVFDNSPYCEQHYHELNGSLCNSCNLGIEGQYLETDQSEKFHPKCFSCSTCRIVLRDGYFEINGRPYCERHASAAQRSMTSLAPGMGGPRTNNLQKRRTRLMMM